jgi:hypothetical protein
MAGRKGQEHEAPVFHNDALREVARPAIFSGQAGGEWKRRFPIIE